MWERLNIRTSLMGSLSVFWIINSPFKTAYTYSNEAPKHRSSFYPDLIGFFIVRVTHMDLWGNMIDEGSYCWAKLAIAPLSPTPSQNLSHTYTMLLSQHCIGTRSHKVPRASIQLCFINMYWKLFSTLLRQVLLPRRLGPVGVGARVYNLSCAKYSRFVVISVPWVFNSCSAEKGNELCFLLLNSMLLRLCSPLLGT